MQVEGAAHQLLASDLVFRRKSFEAGNYGEKTMCAARPGRLVQGCGPAWGYRWHLVASGFPHATREHTSICSGLRKEAAGLDANAELPGCRLPAFSPPHTSPVLTAGVCWEGSNESITHSA